MVRNRQDLIFSVRGACFVATTVFNAHMLGRAVAVDPGADEDVVKSYWIAALVVRGEQLRFGRDQVADLGLCAECLIWQCSSRILSLAAAG
ncbi:hypothetical protein ACU8LZ_25730 (plasmid) [Rhizobium leguminosarum]